MTQPPLPGMPAEPNNEQSGDKPKLPKYAHFTVFAQEWLFPAVQVRLAENNREDTFTWCHRWWLHRSVSVRIAHLHTAFEAARQRHTISDYMLGHVDPHMRWILDAANGPLHRCTRACHVALPPLSADPMPPDALPRIKQNPPTTDKDGKKPPPPLRFTAVADFVTQWLLPITAVRTVGQNREGTYTWCPRWWEHPSVVVRFGGIHRVFEAARVSDDPTSMSSLFVRQIDPHMRHILDASKGPLHNCTPTRHTPTPGLSAPWPPPGWFDQPGENIAVEDLGFGPDFRLLAPALPHLRAAE
ncbi:hypothetical protein C5E45_23920 [Nocardia nova]|uniref:DUF4913 domain-containing protein n=1 Tax=Nocardia nova TaxID=37330 RepID=A0A2S6AKV7_9NOCA|nr:DUF4913 domain-containing protein [Nocardia nova]PPJ35854.1 hypothetical protein C5E45_23920 [Nocardia nova]